MHLRVAPQLASPPSIIGTRCTVSKTGSIITESTFNNRLELALLGLHNVKAENPVPLTQRKGNISVDNKTTTTILLP
jgi:hypothetical protein